MNYLYVVSLAAFSLCSALLFAGATWRRPYRLLLLLAAFSINASAQSLTTILDPTRSVAWSNAGFTIPTYSVTCPTQPSLTAGSGAASANTTSIQNALASCTSTQNVVNIPAGTWYVTAITYSGQGHQVLRGAGPNSTDVIFTSGTGCAGGLTGGICMKDANGMYDGNPAVIPPSGNSQCAWTGGLTQGSTSITLSSCGGAPPVNKTIILDQANDTSDPSGIYICDTNIGNCGYEGSSGGNNDGRSISGVTHSEQQVTYVTGVTSLGNGSYTVTISPGVYFTNIRSSQSPGAWWPGFVQNDGLENMTVDGSNVNSTVSMYDCYQCWEKNVRSINAGRNHVMLYQSANDVIRDSYFYQSQSHYSESYVVEVEEASGFLVENNIFQQVTNPLMFGQGSGAVIGYNFSIDDIYSGATAWASAAYSVHNGGNVMNLWEGNNFLGIWADDAWGSSSQETYFRNMLIGWQIGVSNATVPVLLRANDRGFSLIGNVLGQPKYHTQYQTYATSTTAGVGAAQESTSIYTVGWGGTGPVCSSGAVTACDPLAFTTLMRWGNYDTANGSVQWNAAEAAPIAVPFLNANFLSTYFSALTQTLPYSLYYSSAPSWWPTTKPWPPTGPDVTSGNLGVCTGGTYAGAQATSASQCAGGTLSSGWASHANSIPAQDCFLNTMLGPPDGSGGELSFDANVCYYGSSTKTTGPGVPPALTATPVVVQ
jgi:hypothetical protein